MRSVAFLVVSAFGLQAYSQNWSFIPEKSPLHEYEQKGAADDILQVQNLRIENQDSLEIVIYKLRLAYRIMDHQLSEKYSDEPRECYLEITEHALKRFPHLTSVYLYNALAKVVRRHEYEVLGDLLSRVQEVGEYPGIAQICFQILETEYQTKKNVSVQPAEIADPDMTDATIVNIFRRMGNDNVAILRKLYLLRTLWGLRVDRKYSGKYARHALDEIHKNGFANSDEQMEAYEIWRQVIAHYGAKMAAERGIKTIQQERLAVEKRLWDDIHEQQKRQDERAAQDIEAWVAKLVSLEALPNPPDEIEERLTPIARHRRQVEARYPALPNLEAVRKKVSPEEADLLNVYYLAYVRKSYADALPLLDKLADRTKSARTLWIRAYVLGGLKRNDEALKAADELLELDPKNPSYLMMKQAIEAERSGRQAESPKAPDGSESSPNRKDR